MPSASKPTSTPISASTIVIARDSQNNDSMEIFMVVRHHQIDFASGALVFPGGKVSSSDSDPGLRNKCKGHESWDDDALAFGIAAIRESFEESGLLLARRKDEESLINNSSLDALSHYRVKLEKSEITMDEFASQENLNIALDQLHHFGHWVTPDMVPKRFDTQFYLAKAPEDQDGSHDGCESVDSIWISPEQALKDADEGKLKVIFPTRMNLMRLAQYKNVQEAIESCEHQEVVMIMPWTEPRDSGAALCIPKDAGYDVAELPLELVMRS